MHTIRYIVVQIWSNIIAIMLGLDTNKMGHCLLTPSPSLGLFEILEFTVLKRHRQNLPEVLAAALYSTYLTSYSYSRRIGVRANAARV